MQVADDAACLNSGDCFILCLAPKATQGVGRVIAWEGRGASDDEKRCAKTIAVGGPVHVELNQPIACRRLV